MATLIRLVIASLLLGTLACSPKPRGAIPTQLLDAFLTPDQQGRMWLEAGEPLRAARAFDDRMWKGLAYYAADDYASAAAALAPLDTARAHFQRGNAWARLERLPEAVYAYERALELRPEFPEARFNLEWVGGLLELDQKEYEDFGGTGGQLEADKIVVDERGARGTGEMNEQEARSQGLSEAQLRELWMRRVQTTPGEFLKLKFSYQLQRGSSP